MTIFEPLAAEAQGRIGRLLEARGRLWRLWLWAPTSGNRAMVDQLSADQVVLEAEVPAVAEQLGRTGSLGLSEWASIASFFVRADQHLARVNALDAGTAGTPDWLPAVAVGLGFVILAAVLRRRRKVR